MKSVSALVVCVLAAAASCANGLFFYVVEGQQRCFIEEVPADTLVIGKYKNPDFKPYGDPGFTETVRYSPLPCGRFRRKLSLCRAFVQW